MIKLPIISAIGVALLLVSCGGNSASRTQPIQSSNYNRTDDAKVNCVANDGFLVPIKGGFACELPSGRRLSLASL